MSVSAHTFFEPVVESGPELGPRDLRGDPYLGALLFGLIEDSYLYTRTFTQFAAEVLQVIAYAATVPMAFTEGFVRAYLSIEKVVEDDDGRITVVPKADATIEDMTRDVDEITAQIEPGAVYNPVVRATLDAAHQTSRTTMKWDLDTLSSMDDEQLMDVLRELQAESDASPVPGTGADEASDVMRARIATVRRNVRRFQARHAAAVEAAEGLIAAETVEGPAASAGPGAASAGTGLDAVSGDAEYVEI